MRFLNLLHRVLGWFRKRKPEKEPPVVLAVPPGAPIDLTGEPVPAEPAWVRYYEKQRRKHDKFVTPAGELPERTPRPRPAIQEIKPKTPKPPEVIPPPEPLLPAGGFFSGLNIVDQHHEDGGKVLYTTNEMMGEFNFRDTIL